MWDSQGRVVAHQPSGDFQCGEALRLCEFLGMAQIAPCKLQREPAFRWAWVDGTLATRGSEHVPGGTCMPRCGSTATETF